MTGKLNTVLVNSLVAAFCGLMLMWFSHTFQYPARMAADKINSMLYHAEFPARELRFLVQAADHWMSERKSLQERARVLEQENIALRLALQRLGVNPPQSAPGLLGASVTLRYPDAWWKEIRVDKGSSQGVVAGAPVLSEGFMIGRVSRIGEDYAWIELVTSSAFLLAAVVVDTWDLGVINGDDIGNVWLMYMPPEKEFSDGMLVSTALVGDYLPPGIPLGLITGPGETKDGLTPFKVVSGARLAQLYNVQILISSGEGRSS